MVFYVSNDYYNDFYMRKILGPNTILLKQLYWRDFFITAVKYLPNANKFTYMDYNED